MGSSLGNSCMTTIVLTSNEAESLKAEDFVYGLCTGTSTIPCATMPNSKMQMQVARFPASKRPQSVEHSIEVLGVAVWKCIHDCGNPWKKIAFLGISFAAVVCNSTRLMDGCRRITKAS